MNVHETNTWMGKYYYKTSVCELSCKRKSFVLSFFYQYIIIELLYSLKLISQYTVTLTTRPLVWNLGNRIAQVRGDSRDW